MPVPKDVEIISGARLDWARSEMRRKTNGQTERYTPIICALCGNEQFIQSGSLVYQIKNGNFTGRCKSCAPLIKRESVLNEYRKRGLQKLPDGTLIDWATTEAPPKGISGKAFTVEVVCFCGFRRKRQVGTIYRKESVQKTICRKCADKKLSEKMARKNNPNFKRGYWITSNGYKEVVIEANHPMIKMASNIRVNGSGKILEHRLVMAMALGRCLETWEQVHHLNNVKTDNRLENLQLVNPKEHSAVTAMEREIKKLRRKLALFESESK